MLSAALIDFGGTLYPEFGVVPRPGGVDREQVRAGQRARLAALVAPEDLDSVFGALEAGVHKDRSAPFHVTRQIAIALAGTDHEGLDPVAVRRAMSVPAIDLEPLLPGARELLTLCADEGIKTVLVSNTLWRTADDYRQDFADFGVPIDAIVASADLPYSKPHRSIFDVALAAAGDPMPSTCVMIGNSEAKDVAPSKSLGMRTILMAPDGTESGASAVAGSLYEAASLIAKWHAEPAIGG